MAIFSRRPKPPPEVELIGRRPEIFSDFYHLLLRSSWWLLIGVIATSFLLANGVFAVAYRLVGGISGAHGLRDYFFFSVQTIGTIGYGSMYPEKVPAHVVVTIEAMFSMLLTALSTGLIFTKFSVPRARLRFAEHPVISLLDGVPTLLFRVGNERDASLIEASTRVVLVRTERTKEGRLLYRMYDLPLVRDRSPALTRSWMIMHRIDERSLLFGATPESLAREEIELIVTVTGIDEASVQMHHGRHRYQHQDVLWGARHTDMLSELPDGRIRLDLNNFDLIDWTEPTDSFPYPRPQDAAAKR